MINSAKQQSGNFSLFSDTSSSRIVFDVCGFVFAVCILQLAQVVVLHTIAATNGIVEGWTDDWAF